MELFLVFFCFGFLFVYFIIYLFLWHYGLNPGLRHAKQMLYHFGHIHNTFMFVLFCFVLFVVLGCEFRAYTLSYSTSLFL
jgi:hypothetical protein